MRKVLLILLVVFALPTIAQNDYQFRMSSFMSEDALQTQSYQYLTPDGADLAAIHEIDLVTYTEPQEIIDSLVYDAEGRIIRIDTHQLLDGQWLKVCWVEYTYNEMGLKDTRKNYNDFHDGWGPQLGGIYYYYYNEQGQMTNWELDFAGIIFDKGELTYNEKGLLEKEVILNNPFTGIYEETARLEYFYDENDWLVELHNYAYDMNTASVTLQSINVNEYDEVGNCTVAMSTTPSGVPQEKKVFSYDDKVLAEDIYFYPNPESDFPVFPQMHNMLLSYEYYALDQNSGNLTYVLDYLVGYELIGELELSVVAEASHDTICLGGTIELTAEVSGGTADYTFSWTPADMLDDAEAQTTTATPTEAGEYTFTVTVDDGIDQVEASVTVFVKDCTGVEEQVLNNVNIYPNPAQDFIMIDSENVEYVEVIDIYGRVITSSEINGETRIEMSDFADGIYYVRLHSNGATAVQKVVKN